MSPLISLRVVAIGALLMGVGAPIAGAQPARIAKPSPARRIQASSGPATSTQSAAKTPAPAVAGGVKAEDRARQMTNSMTQALGLAPAQVQRVQEINLLSVQRVEEARRKYARALPRMHAEVELIGNSRLSLLKDVLSDQQFKAYAAMREKKMGIPEALKQQAALSESASGE